MRIGALLLLACALVPAVAGASQVHARVSVVTTVPFSVHGSGFRSRERVTVTVAATSMRTKTVTATRRGAFTATFKGFSVPHCDGYTVKAKGNRGSLATLNITPECPPPDQS
jgi:hypothetical protein